MGFSLLAPFPPSSLLFFFLSFSFSPGRPSLPFPNPLCPTHQFRQGEPHKQIWVHFACLGLGSARVGACRTWVEGKDRSAGRGNIHPTSAHSGLPLPLPGLSSSFLCDALAARPYFSAGGHAPPGTLRGFKEAAFSAMKSHGREASPCSGGSQSPWKVKKRMPVWGQGVCITIPPLPFNRERSCGLQAPRSSPPFNFLLACDRNWFIFMFTFTFHV